MTGDRYGRRSALCLGLLNAFEVWALHAYVAVLFAYDDRTSRLRQTFVPYPLSTTAHIFPHERRNTTPYV